MFGREGADQRAQRQPELRGGAGRAFPTSPSGVPFREEGGQERVPGHEHGLRHFPRHTVSVALQEPRHVVRHRPEKVL